MLKMHISQFQADSVVKDRPNQVLANTTLYLFWSLNVTSWHAEITQIDLEKFNQEIGNENNSTR